MESMRQLLGSRQVCADIKFYGNKTGGIIEETGCIEERVSLIKFRILKSSNDSAIIKILGMWQKTNWYINQKILNPVS